MDAKLLAFKAKPKSVTGLVDGKFSADGAREEYQNHFKRPEDRLCVTLDQIPDFKITGSPQKLSGGLLNFVWRLNGTIGSVPHTLIVKSAPPYIASSPEVYLDPDRIFFEARMLEAFSTGGILEAIGSEKVRPPRLILLDRKQHLLVMEDVCQCPDLEAWLKESHSTTEAADIGRSLGKFIGALHRFSAQRPQMADEFNNQSMQQTRLAVLYGNVHNYALRAHLPDAEQLGKLAVEYGELLQQPGKALIMGDLWLPSVMVSTHGLRVIDWELAHYGRPSQDVGHFAAHLWMHIHRANTPGAAKNAETILEKFLVSYRLALGTDFDEILGAAGVMESAIHFGSEILARTVGLFQQGYLYQGLSSDHPLVQQAAQTAANHILDPQAVNTFDALGWRSTKGR